MKTIIVKLKVPDDFASIKKIVIWRQIPGENALYGHEQAEASFRILPIQECFDCGKWHKPMGECLGKG